MQTLRRSFNGALILVLVVQIVGPVLQAGRACASASVGATCCCCRHAGGADRCPMCSRARHDGNVIGCRCGCQGQPSDTVTAPTLDPEALLPDRVPGFVDGAVSPAPATRTIPFQSFAPSPPSPPPW